MIKLSECEEQVMTIIWNSIEDLKRTEIRDKVEERFKHEWALQTVSTFLSRLCTKGYLTTTRKGVYIYYHPEITLEDYRREKMKDLVNMLYNGDVETAKVDLV